MKLLFLNNFRRTESLEFFLHLLESDQCAKLFHYVRSKSVYAIKHLNTLTIHVNWSNRIKFIWRVFSRWDFSFTFLDHVSSLKSSFKTTSRYIFSIISLRNERWCWSSHDLQLFNFIITLISKTSRMINLIDSWVLREIYFSLRIISLQSKIRLSSIEQIFFLVNFDISLISST